jgi:DNA-binding transcriptional LysR family regulator
MRSSPDSPQPLDLDPNDLVIFVRVVDGGSFTEAARRLGMPKSTVSRRVSEVEARLGAQLLSRTTRKLSLTEIGRAVYAQGVHIVQSLDETRALVERLTQAPTGLLRVSAPLAFASFGAVFAELMSTYPDLSVELVCTDRRVDLVEERFDLALRAGNTPDSSLVSQKIGSVARLVVASPKFLEQLPPIATPTDLAGVGAVVFAPEGASWTLFRDEASSAKRKAGPGEERKSVTVRVDPRLVVNDYDMLRAIVEGGFGVALVPAYQCPDALERQSLTRLLPRWAGADVPIFALYPSTRHVPEKVRAFVTLLRARDWAFRPG